jgi:CHAT domain-containing protein
LDATPRGFLDAMPSRFSMIHFAAHAETNPRSPLESAVILSRNGDSYKLYARDVTKLQLSADLVTISACRSAGARAYGGEGLVGLAWAFLHSGAQAVIAGLWDVSDSSSAQLMDKLYESLASKDAPATALRMAKLSLLHGGGSYRKPFYWAPYQIYIR